MPLTPTQVAINAEVQGWVTANLQLAQSNYVIKQLESKYTRNYDLIQNQVGLSPMLTAIKELQQISYTTHTPTNLQLRAYIKEVRVVAPQLNATMHNVANLGLVTAQSTNVTFTKATGSPTINVTPFGPGALPACAVGDYLYVHNRANTLGVNTTAPVGSPGIDGTIQAQVREDTVVALHTGGTLALADGVEWPIASGSDAHVTYNALTSSAVVFSVPSAYFPGLVAVGDVVQLVARTMSPTTANPSLAGYYKVTGVGNASLLLDRKKYTRTSEGMYTVDPTNLPNMADDLDWHVIRTAQHVLYLRHAAQNFTPVLAGDYVHATATPGGTQYTFTALSSPATGLILLDPTQYTGASAPYTATTNVTTPFTATCSYNITRAPGATAPTAMAVFNLTAAADFIAAGVQVNYFVHLTNGTGPFGPTAHPANLGYFKVTAVAQHVLALDHQPYVQDATTGKLVPSGAPVYGTYTDDADYSLLRSTVSYPNSHDPADSGALHYKDLLYEVVAVQGPVTAPTGIQLDPVRHEGYAKGSMELALTSLGATGDFIDYFDVDVVRTYGPQLLVKVASGTFPTTLIVGADTFAVSSARLTPAAPTTAPARQAMVTGAFGVTGHPIPNVLLLGRDHHVGRAIEGPGTQFAPYLPSANQSVPVGSWSEPVDFYVTTQDITRYDRVVVVGDTNAFADVHALDYVYPSDASLPTYINNVSAPILAQVLFNFFEIANIASTHTATVGPLRCGRTTQNFPLSKLDLTFSAPFDATTLSSFAVDLTGFAIVRSSPVTTYVALSNLALVPAIRVGDFVALTTQAPSALTEVFQLTGINVTSLTMAPVQVTGSDGVYVVTTTPLTLDMRDKAVATFEIQRPTGNLAQVSTYLTAFAAALPPAVKSALDTALGQIYNATFDMGTPAPLLASATAAIQQVAQYIPQQAFTLRGFAEGATTGPDPGVTTPANLAGFDISQVPTAAVDHRYQNMLAIALVAQYDAVFIKAKLQDLKDIYIDARLQVLGYAAEAHNVPSSATAALFEAANEMRAAQQIVTSVTRALTTLAHLDIKTLVDTQLANLLPIIQSALPPTFYPVGGLNAYFVRSGGGGNWFASALAGFPATFITALSSDSALERRKAFQVLIAVPTESSLRIKRRTYARLRSKQRSRTASLADLTNHLAQATDPATHANLFDAVTSLTAQYTTDAVTLAGFTADLSLREALPDFIGPPAPSTEDLQMTETRADLEVDGSDGASAGNFAAPVALVTSATSTSITSVSSSAVIDTTVFPSPISGVTVSNLFTGDIHDFRVTSAIIPYYSRNSSHNGATNFATISLCDFNLENKGAMVIELPSYGKLPSVNNNCEYNQFKMTGLQETYAEKFQITDTLSETFMVFSFGRRPEVWSMSGTLINDIASDQLGKFRELYENYIRLSALERRKQKMVLKVPALGIEVYGYAVAFTPQSSAEGVAAVVPFNLQFVVTNVVRVPQIKKLNNSALVPISGLVRYLHAHSGLTGGGGIRSATNTSAATAAELNTPVVQALNHINDAKLSIASTLSNFTFDALTGAF